MMTTNDFVDYLETIIDNVTFFDCFCDESTEKSLTTYYRSNAVSIEVHNFRLSKTQLLPITLMLTYTRSNSEAQKKMFEVYETLKKTSGTVNGYKFFINTKQNALPVSLSKNEAGFFQYAVDFDVYYSKI